MQRGKYILNDKPFYRQIADQITTDIFCCKLQPGQRLQSIRQLSIKYHMNPNTIQRAVEELKRKRLLIKHRQGLFITPDTDLISQFRQQQSDEITKAFSQKMAQLGYTRAEVRQMIQQF